MALNRTAQNFFKLLYDGESEESAITKSGLGLDKFQELVIKNDPDFISSLENFRKSKESFQRRKLKNLGYQKLIEALENGGQSSVTEEWTFRTDGDGETLYNQFKRRDTKTPVSQETLKFIVNLEEPEEESDDKILQAIETLIRANLLPKEVRQQVDSAVINLSDSLKAILRNTHEDEQKALPASTLALLQSELLGIPNERFEVK